ncbi:MAG: toxin [Desulfuromonas sp.]|nr:MAG: toxin [Desulfuromonas sp.]
MSVDQRVENLADEYRERLWGDSIPVDPVTIAKKLGIAVVQTKLPQQVSGAIIKERGKDAIIVLERSDSDQRKRFTCAHELGHFVDLLEENNGKIDEFEQIDLRDPESSVGINPSEIFANQFAAALIMPKDAVVKLHNKNLSKGPMAAKLGVSPAAISFRLKNLGLPGGRF